MAEGAALLVDEVLPREPMRQWVLSVPFALRYLFATDLVVMGQVRGIVTRAIGNHLIKAAGCHHATAQTGAVTLIQRFGSALNLNIQNYWMSCCPFPPICRAEKFRRRAIAVFLCSE